MNEQDIIHYLETPPVFFSRPPSLLKKLTFRHPQKRTISLTEAQLTQIPSRNYRSRLTT
ncbi:DUF484 family protein [Rodentibacter pneumotropicus]|uniref:DUF484 family protein n=1 Tax=Rodentibacter pneumotropicus TaxID=758 RepID=A0AAW5LAG0_9PAST|nr:DUF484 family protein [Rodentibacter pneumotropicus]MCQ9121035.1 DUF484 family protein [Rodentibacter pneumotropicus]